MSSKKQGAFLTSTTLRIYSLFYKLTAICERESKLLIIIMSQSLTKENSTKDQDLKTDWHNDLLTHNVIKILPLQASADTCIKELFN